MSIILDVNKRIVIAIFGLLALCLSALPASAQSSKTLVWNRLDCDITIQPNGDLRIVETNVINFTSGSFTFGYRDINQSRLTGVQNVQVTEGNSTTPLRIETTTSDAGAYRIKYYFSRAAQNETRTFNIAYTIKGATRYYDAGDQVYWACVYADRNGFSVLNSRSTIRLPNGTTASDAATYGPQATMTGQGESIVTATANEAIPSGKEFEVRVQFPHGVITGNAPAWQQAYDAQRQYDEVTKPRNDLIGLIAGALAFLLGPLGTLVLWQTRGKDPNVGLVADYITEPPTGIAPGVAGTIVDEKVDLPDILATLIDLARRGVISLQENRTDTPNDWIMRREAGANQARLAPFEQRILSALKLDEDGDPKQMSALKNKFYANIGLIENDLYQALVDQKLYPAKPPTVRNSYSTLGGLLIAAGVVTFCGSTMFTDVSSFIVCVPIAIFITGIILLIIARAMPSATRDGAEVKMKLQAFKRYLQNIEKYVDLNTAKDQFDKYLPFAIAFGLERSWIQKFSRVNTPAPDWYLPYNPYPRPYGYGRGYGGGYGPARPQYAPQPSDPAGDIRGAASSSPNLDDMNKGMTASLSSLNSGMTTMLASAASTMVSRPAPVVTTSRSGGGSWGSGSTGGWSSGGGGWSGGGGSSGGSSGGGGGGFG